MKFLKCKICLGEVDLISNDRASHKKIKCRKCGFSNSETANEKITEVFVIKRPILGSN